MAVSNVLWKSCWPAGSAVFGVTLAAVARSMRLSIQSCQMTASGLMDFKGTLAVDRSSPVGLTELKLVVEISSQEPEASIEKTARVNKTLLCRPPDARIPARDGGDSALGWP